MLGLAIASDTITSSSNTRNLLSVLMPFLGTLENKPQQTNASADLSCANAILQYPSYEGKTPKTEKCNLGVIGNKRIEMLEKLILQGKT